MYRQTLDNFARGVLAKAPNIPDYHLMVGSAETLESLPVLVYENAKIPTELVAGYTAIQQNDPADIQQAIADNSLEVNDLSWNIALIGAGLGV